MRFCGKKEGITPAIYIHSKLHIQSAWHVVTVVVVIARNDMHAFTHNFKVEFPPQKGDKRLPPLIVFMIYIKPNNTPHQRLLALFFFAQLRIQRRSLSFLITAEPISSTFYYDAVIVFYYMTALKNTSQASSS